MMATANATRKFVDFECLSLSQDRLPTEHKLHLIVVALLDILVSVFGVILNGGILVTLRRSSQLRSLSNLIQGGLALADLCTSSLTLPLSSIHQILLFLDTPICWAFASGTFLGHCTTIVSISVLCLVTTDRFASVFYPYRYIRWSTHANLYVAKSLFIIWILGILLSLSVFFNSTKFLFPTFCAILMFILFAWSIYVYGKLYMVSFSALRQSKKVKPSENNFLKNLPSSSDSGGSSKPGHNNRDSGVVLGSTFDNMSCNLEDFKPSPNGHEHLAELPNLKPDNALSVAIHRERDLESARNKEPKRFSRASLTMLTINGQDNNFELIDQNSRTHPTLKITNSNTRSTPSTFRSGESGFSLTDWQKVASMSKRMALLVFAQFSFFVPLGVVSALKHKMTLTTWNIAHLWVGNIAYLQSVFNPLIYFWSIRELRKIGIRKLNTCFT